MGVSLAKTQEVGRAAVSWRGTYLRLNALFLGLFFAFGAVYPLLSRFLEAKGFSGTEIGVLTAVGSFVAIVAQPAWGMICDATGQPRRVLIVALVTSGTIALGFLAADGFAAMLALLVGLHLFQSAIVPISDSLALRFARRSGVAYGNIRLWGAVGFASAAFVAGKAAEAFGLGVLFPLYTAALIASVWIVRRLPDQGEETQQVRLWRGLRDLLRLPPYALFVLSAFLVFGPINGNNLYFGLLFQALGGSVASIGLAFLLFAGSEVIFLRTADWFVRRWGLAGTLLLASAVSAGRWLWYATAPPLWAVLALFLLQGFSVGLYLAAAPPFVRELAPRNLQATALGIFAAFGHGLGTVASNFLGGLVMDRYSIFGTYVLFGGLTLLGMLPILWIARRSGAARRPVDGIDA